MNRAQDILLTSRRSTSLTALFQPVDKRVFSSKPDSTTNFLNVRRLVLKKEFRTTGRGKRMKLKIECRRRYLFFVHV